MKQVFFIVIFLFHIGFLDALETNSTRIVQLEKEMDALREELHELMLSKAGASANPDIMSDEWFIFFETLHWYQRTNGTAFAYSNNTLATTLPLKGRTKDIDFGWSWGLRVGGGKNLEFDRWDLSGAFTYYSSHVSGTARSGQASILIPLRGAVVTATGVTNAKSTYAMDLYNLDVELGRHYYISDKLSFRPFIGVKGARVDQRQVIRYTGGSLAQNTANIKDYCDYSGIGTKGGINSRWHLGDGWHIDGLISGALLYGFFDIEHRERVTPSHLDRIKLEDNKHRFVPMVQWRLGLTWGSYFNVKENYVDLAVAYEGMYWWRQNQMLKIYEYTALRYDNFSEDLSMHGLTFSIKLYL
ncbi:MAG: hypothetical protein K1060chlam2_00775 [Chlamydiae bacterium]|nr:hypothetical protein [Chlamydiota bacterium]